MTSRVTGALALLALLYSACGDKSADPVPTVDLSAHFVLPHPGFTKSYSDAAVQTYVDTATVVGFPVVDVLRESGNHEYFRVSDRAWVGTLIGDTVLFRLEPPLAAIPEQMPFQADVIATSTTPFVGDTVPVARLSRLIDTGLTVVVPAGTFDRAVRIWQTFTRTETILGSPVTKVDSAYRWYAPGVDEIKRIQWLDGDADSTLREFTGGTVSGVTYPILR